MKRIPPHIGWPLMVVGFLALGVTWSLGVVVASQSDGGPAVVTDYYEKAISWDDEIKRRTQSEAFDWDIAIKVVNGETGPELITTIRDAQGIPVDGFTGSMKAARPQEAQPVATLQLLPSHTEPGVYRSPFPQLTKGLWDFQIDAENGTRIVYTTIRQEF